MKTYLTLTESSDDILLELNYNALLRNTETNFDTPRKQNSNHVRIKDVEFVPSIRDGTLTVVGKSEGAEKDYTTRLMFSNIKFVQEPSAQHVTVTGADGTEYHFSPVKIGGGHHIRVNCECLDFYYRFAAWNHAKKALDGTPPKPYIKKTNRPPVNPNKVPGVCKHIIKFIDQLKSEKVFA
jgi:hypothetical protein